MEMSTGQLPPSLRRSLNTAGKKFGENLENHLVLGQIDGEEVFEIAFFLGLNWRMFDLEEAEISDPNSEIFDPTSQQFQQLAYKICVHLFGDNVSTFQKRHHDNNSSNTWEIMLSSLSYIDEWLAPKIHLKPVKTDS